MPFAHFHWLFWISGNPRCTRHVRIQPKSSYIQIREYAKSSFHAVWIVKGVRGGSVSCLAEQQK